MKDRFSWELPYYRHELKPLASDDNKDKAGDLKSSQNKEPNEYQEHDRENGLSHSIVIDIGIYSSTAHVQTHALHQFSQKFDSNRRSNKIEASMEDHGVDDPSCTDINKREQNS